MAIEKLAGLADSLSGLQGRLDDIADSFQNPIGDAADAIVAELTDRYNDSPAQPPFELPDSVSDFFDSIPSFPGLNLGSGSGLGSFGECFKNIDDILIDKLKDKIIEMALNTPAGAAAANAAATTFATINVVQETMDKIISLKQESLMDLIAKVQNSSFLQRISVIKKITDLYGNVICNLNNLISKVLSLDPCKLLDELETDTSVGGPNAKPLNMAEGDMADFPTIIEPMSTNPKLMAVNDGFLDAKFRIGEALSKDNSDPEAGVPAFAQSDSHNAALTTLHHLAHSFRNQLRGLGSGNSELALANIQQSRDRIVREKAAEWSQDAMDFFVKKFDKQLLPTLEGAAPDFENYDNALISPTNITNDPNILVSEKQLSIEDSSSSCAPKAPSEAQVKVNESYGLGAGETLAPPDVTSYAPREAAAMEPPASDPYEADYPATISIPEWALGGGTWKRVPFSNSYERTPPRENCWNRKDYYNLAAGEYSLKGLADNQFRIWQSYHKNNYPTIESYIESISSLGNKGKYHGDQRC